MGKRGTRSQAGSPSSTQRPPRAQRSTRAPPRAPSSQASSASAASSPSSAGRSSPAASGGNFRSGRSGSAVRDVKSSTSTGDGDQHGSPACGGGGSSAAAVPLPQRMRPLLRVEQLRPETFKDSPVGPHGKFCELLVPLDESNCDDVIYPTPFGPCGLHPISRFSLDECVFLEELDAMDLEDTLLGHGSPPGAAEPSVRYDHLVADLLFNYWRSEGFASRLLNTLQLFRVVTGLAMDRKRLRASPELEAEVALLKSSLKSATDAAAAQTRRTDQAEARLQDQAKRVRELQRELDELRQAPLQHPSGLMRYLTSNARVTGHRSRLEELLQRYARRDRTQLSQDSTIISVTALGAEAASLEYVPLASPPGSPSSWFASPDGGSPAPDNARGSSHHATPPRSIPSSSAGSSGRRDSVGDSSSAAAGSLHSVPVPGVWDASLVPSPSASHPPLAEEHDFGGGTPHSEAEDGDVEMSEAQDAPGAPAADVDASVDSQERVEAGDDVDMGSDVEFVERRDAEKASAAAKSSGAAAAALAARTDFADGLHRFEFRGVPRRELKESKLRLGPMRQTAGFPDYQVTNFFRQQVYSRYTTEQYVELLQDRPWRAMFERRVKSLFLVSETNPIVEAVAPLIWDFMYAHQRAFWESFHWLPIPQSQDSSSIYYLRSQRRSSLKSQFSTLERAFVAKHGTDYRYLRELLWCEPAFWHVPDQPCAWVPPENADIPVEQRPRLRELAQEIDSLEPVRFGYATDVGLTKFYEHLTPGLRGGLARRLRAFESGKYKCFVPGHSEWSPQRVDVDNLDCTLEDAHGQPWEGHGWSLAPDEEVEAADDDDADASPGDADVEQTVEGERADVEVAATEIDDDDTSVRSGSPHALPQDL